MAGCRVGSSGQPLRARVRRQRVIYNARCSPSTSIKSPISHRLRFAFRESISRGRSKEPNLTAGVKQLRGTRPSSWKLHAVHKRMYEMVTGWDESAPIDRRSLAGAAQRRKRQCIRSWPRILSKRVRMTSQTAGVIGLGRSCFSESLRCRSQ